MSHSRFVVGIDLGTTNCAVSYLDTGAGDEPALQHLPIPQVVQPGVVEERPLLPSFLYLPGPNEQPAGVLINFYTTADTVRFEINEAAVEKSGLKVSSKLFKLAKVIEAKP